MRKLIACSVAALAALTVTAAADLSVKDGGGATQTIFNFVCFTTKLCNATVVVNSAGTEIGTTSNPVAVALPAATVTTLTPPAAITGFGTAANQTTMIGHIDGVETLITSTNTKLDTLDGRVDTLETLIASTNTKLDTLNTNVTSPIAAGTAYIGKTRATDGTNDGLLDPCDSATKVTVPFTLATAAVKVAVTGVSAKKIYVCAYELTNNAADSVALFEATTGTVCATSPIAVVGAGTSVATAATGFNFGANGGIARGNGAAQVLQTSTNANDLCVAQSATTQLTGSFTYVTR